MGLRHPELVEGFNYLPFSAYVDSISEFVFFIVKANAIRPYGNLYHCKAITIAQYH